jgi:hypothetical protein
LNAEKVYKELNPCLNMKRDSKIFILIFLLSVISLSFVSANPVDTANRVINDFLDVAIETTTPLFQRIIGDYDTNKFFFAKILLLLLLIIVINKVMAITPIGEENKKVSFFVALIVSIIAIRFIQQSNLIESLLIPYNSLGIGIVVFLPLVIFFYFIHKTRVKSFGRKVAWAIYLAAFIGIWISQNNEGKISALGNNLYLFASLGILFAILFDRSFHSYMGYSHLGNFLSKSNKEAILQAKERIKKAEARMNQRIISHYEYRQVVKEENALIKELSKED